MTRLRFLAAMVALAGLGLLGLPGEARSDIIVDDDYMYAAIAYSPATGKYGYSWNCDTRGEAEQRALNACKADDARIVCWVNNGFCALALGDDKSRWGVGWSWGDGASTAVRIAVATSGMPQIARPKRQEPSASGSTSGIVSMTASVSPTSSPLAQAAVAKVTRCGVHCRISGGTAGCITAMPALITAVAV